MKYLLIMMIGSGYYGYGGTEIFDNKLQCEYAVNAILKKHSGILRSEDVYCMSIPPERYLKPITEAPKR